MAVTPSTDVRSHCERSPSRAVSRSALSTGEAGVSGTNGIVTHRSPVHQGENPEGRLRGTQANPGGTSGRPPFRRAHPTPTLGSMTASDTRGVAMRTKIVLGAVAAVVLAVAPVSAARQA